MWHRFGQGFREIILRAAEQTEAEEGRSLSTRHLLWGLETEAALPAAQILARLGIDPGTLYEVLGQAASGETPQEGGAYPNHAFSCPPRIGG